MYDKSYINVKQLHQDEKKSVVELLMCSEPSFTDIDFLSMW